MKNLATLSVSSQERWTGRKKKCSQVLERVKSCIPFCPHVTGMVMDGSDGPNDVRPADKTYSDLFHPPHSYQDFLFSMMSCKTMMKRLQNASPFQREGFFIVDLVRNRTS